MTKSVKCGLLAVILVCSTLSASAQTTVVTQPQPVTTGNKSNTIAAAGTYQQILAADTSARGRVGCSVINNGTHTMYVYFGPIANATHASSVQLAAGQATYCSTGNGGVLKDQVSIDGTTNDAFYAAVQ